MQEKPVGDAGPVTDHSSEALSSSADSGFPEFPTKDINRRVAVVSIVAAVGFFLRRRLDFGVSLKDLSASALPYEEVSRSSVA